MLNSSIPSTVTFVAKQLHYPEADIRNLSDDSAKSIRLFTWHILKLIGHSVEAIAREFQTTPNVVTNGIAEWTATISRIRTEPAVKSRILAELNKNIPATNL